MRPTLLLLRQGQGLVGLGQGQVGLGLGQGLDEDDHQGHTRLKLKWLLRTPTGCLRCCMVQTNPW